MEFAAVAARPAAAGLLALRTSSATREHPASKAFSFLSTASSSSSARALSTAGCAAEAGSGSATKAAIRTSFCFPCLVGAWSASYDTALTACSPSATEAAALAIASGAAVRPISCSCGRCVLLWPAIEPSAPSSRPSPFCCIASAGSACEADAVLFAFPCGERARAASALEDVGFTIGASSGEDARFGGAKASVASDFHLTSAASRGFAFPAASVCPMKGPPFACSTAARSSSAAEAGFLYNATDASARVLPRGTVSASPSTYMFRSSRGCLGVVPPASATGLASFLSTSGGAASASPRRAAAIRCRATRADDARTFYQERLFKVSLLCLLVQKVIRDPAAVQAAHDQASAAAWKTVRVAAVLVTCLMIGCAAAKDNDKALLVVKVADAALKCYKFSDEVSKLFF